MHGREYPFPVAEVGLGQMGVMRQGQLEFAQHGATLRAAARLLRQQLDPSIVSSGKQRPLRRRKRDDKLGI